MTSLPVYQDTPSEIPREVSSSCGLAQLNQYILAGRSGVVMVSTTDGATAHAVRQHVLRRARRQWEVLTGSFDRIDGCFCDVAQRLGVPRLSGDPALAAKQLESASAGVAVVLVGALIPGRWDAQVLAKLSRERCQGLFVVVCEESGLNVGVNAGHDTLRVRGESPDTVRIWWEGVIEALVEEKPSGSLASLERWWCGAEGLPLPSKPIPMIEESARMLLGCMLKSHGSWPAVHAEKLGSPKDFDALLQAGWLRLERGSYVLERTDQANPSLSASTLQHVAETMLSVFADNPWARLRASLLLLEAGLTDRVEQQLEEALLTASSTLQRRDLWSVWVEALSGREPSSHRPLALWSARRALAFDDVDAALELAGEAQRGLSEPSHEAYLVMGRAQLARGDIVGARVSLAKSRDMAVDALSEAQPLVSEAEAAFWAGELDLALEYAENVLVLVSEPALRLQARNVIGRVFLAQARWEEAESSFADDEATASSERIFDAVSRARVNRAIAMLSKGDLDGARRVLENVLDQGYRQRHPRAIAIALSNLGVIAHLDGHYARALELYERAIDACHELGDRLGLARPAANLAELRLELGLISEAEQALRFAQCTLRSGVPASISPLLSVLEAEIHLERGNTTQALRSAKDALVNATRSSNGAKVGECYRLIVRIALEDGSMAAAEEGLAQCQQHMESERAQAEWAWLEALLARAKGEDAADLACRASSLARACADRELRRATAVLECEIALADGDLQAAKLHFQSARRVLREMTDGLPPNLVQGVHGRRDIRAMNELGFSLEQQKGNPGSIPPAPEHGENRKGFVGNDPKVRRLLALVQRVSSNSDAPVLISGESGTGKELIAEAIHQHGDRRDRPLIKVNCAALVETLLLSELFGHEKGAFTGASARRRGRFELADGGVLFLDEIGDISDRTQVALLRVLQDGSFERVGGSTPLRADVRVVCATHRDLARMVTEGTFREDLYYRLCGIVLEVPPLRERKQDLMLLVTHFLQEIAKERKEPAKSLTMEAFDILSRHTWPGNVRELQNVLRASSLFADGMQIGPEVVRDQIHMPFAEVESTAPASGSDATGHPSAHWDPIDLVFDQIRQGDTNLGDMKRKLEKECIVRALNETGGNITKAAGLLGMKRPRLSQIIKELGLQKGEG